MNPRKRSALVLVLLVSACFPERREVPIDGARVLTLQREYANTHALVGPDGQVVLIDSGLERNAQAIEADLIASGLDPKKVTAVVLTHAHADHAGGARFFQEKYGARVVVGAGDAAMLAEGKNEPLCPTNADARSRLAGDQAERYQGFTADVLVDGTFDLTPLIGAAAQALPVPGHTAGSLVVKAGSALYVGDLLRGSVFGSDADVHFYMCDLEANARDVRALLADHPEVTTWFVGHFGPLTRAAVEAKFR
jgi:hydroxyacylglutathione hydrolase